MLPDGLDKEIEWAMIRKKMISQTEEFLNEALANPELSVVIPTIPVGSGCFPKSMSYYFWARVLGEL